MSKNKNKIERILKKIYYNPSDPGGYGSAKSLYTAAKTVNPNLKLLDVENFLSKQKTYTLHKTLKKGKQFRKTIVHGTNDTHQADLVDVHNIARENRGHNFILTNIDVFSRKAAAVAIKQKSNAQVVRGFKKIHSKMGIPKKLQTDKGKEFLGKEVQSYFKKKGIHHYSSNSQYKAALAEIFNKSLRRAMFKYFTRENTLTYLDVLDKLVNSYNNRFHRVIETTPNKAAGLNSKDEHKLWIKQFASARKRDLKIPKYKVGDPVRLAVLKRTFEKKSVYTFTPEIFYISGIINSIPITYRVKDNNSEEIQGFFYDWELQKIKLPQD